MSDNVSFVILGMIDNYTVNSVDIDNRKAAKEAVLHLIKLGHKRYCDLWRSAASGHAQKILHGYQNALNSKI